MKKEVLKHIVNSGIRLGLCLDCSECSLREVMTSKKDSWKEVRLPNENFGQVCK